MTFPAFFILPGAKGSKPSSTQLRNLGFKISDAVKPPEDCLEQQRLESKSQECLPSHDMADQRGKKRTAARDCGRSPGKPRSGARPPAPPPTTDGDDSPHE